MFWLLHRALLTSSGHCGDFLARQHPLLDALNTAWEAITFWMLWLLQGYFGYSMESYYCMLCGKLSPSSGCFEYCMRNYGSLDSAGTSSEAIAFWIFWVLQKDLSPFFNALVLHGKLSPPSGCCRYCIGSYPLWDAWVLNGALLPSSWCFGYCVGLYCPLLATVCTPWEVFFRFWMP